MIPKNIKSLQSNRRKLSVRCLDINTLFVSSTSEPGDDYLVTVEFKDGNVVHAECSCEWGQHHGVGCSHVMAALEHLANFKNRTLSFWVDYDEARRQRNRLFRLIADRDKEGIWITSRPAA